MILPAQIRVLERGWLSANNIVFHVQSADDPSIKNDADSRFIGPSVR